MPGDIGFYQFHDISEGLEGGGQRGAVVTRWLGGVNGLRLTCDFMEKYLPRLIAYSLGSD